MSSLGGASTPAKKNNKKNAKKPVKKEEPVAQNDSSAQNESNNDNSDNKPQVNPAPSSSLGGPPKATLGGPPSSLGGPSKVTLGGPPSSLGGPPKATLGGPPSSLGGPPKATLGAPSSLGAPKPAENNNNNNNDNKAEGKGESEVSLNESTESTGEGEAASKSKNKKKEKKKKKPAAVQPAPVKKLDKAAIIAAKIKKEREEEERRKREEEEYRRQEEERRRLEEEEEKKRQEEVLAKIAKKKQKLKDNKKNKKTRMAQQKNQDVLRQLMAQGAVVNVEGKIVPKTKEAKKEKTEEELKAQREKEAAIEKTPEVKEEEEPDDWESLLSDDEDKKGEKQETKAETPVAEETTDDQNQDKRKFRSPICCVLGHVDTGKTLLLDKIRKSNVQKGEAGGITQQIGATYFPIEAIQNLTNSLTTNVITSLKGGKKGAGETEEALNQVNVPGLLIIDTPGHESFTNLRTRGSSLCDIAILVVDIMHGIEQQTEESIRLLKQKKTPFIVALNKIDRLNEWKPVPNAPIHQALEQQTAYVKQLYEEKVKETITLFAEKGLNACLYYRNDDFRKFVSIVPTSAVTGEGIPDLLMLLIQLTQRMMTNQLYLSDDLKCTVLEVKITEGLGTCIDVISSDGTLREGDKIVVCGKNGAIVTTVRALLTPQALREIRVKSNYQHHKKITAAQGIKIVAHDLQDAVAGTQLFVYREGDDLEEIKEEVQQDLENIQNIDRQDVGVYVQASTLGSLEALLCFLKESKIPVANVGIGNIHKKDVSKASVMVEKDKKYACILAFDVKISPDIQLFAENVGVTIFSAPIIYHLEQAFTNYLDKIESEKRKAHASEAVWPCVLEIFPEHIFNKRNPIILGVKVVRGELKLLTPVCVIKETETLYLGRVASIEENHKNIDAAKAGSEVAIKIEHDPSNTTIYAFERHFDHTHQLMSRITRHSLDRLKEFFGSSLSKKDIKLLREMKEIYNID